MKRILSLILAIVVFTTQVYFVLAEDAEIASYSPTEKEIEAAEVLKGFGTIDDGFDLAKDLTRAEFTTLLIKATEQNINVSGSLPFADVTAEMDCFNAVSTAYGLGLVSKADLFNPESPVLFEHAQKMLVLALGYSIPANNKGGWSAGYGAVANNLQLSKGANVSYGAALNGYNAACMILNMLKSPAFVQTVYGPEERYEADRDSVYMSETLDIYEAEGIVTANTLTDLKGGTANEFTVKVDGVKYYVGNSSAGLYLGQCIEFYYRKAETDTIATILYASPDMRNNEIIELDARDINKSATTAKKIAYFVDDENEETDLESDAEVIYNGKRLFGFNKENLTPEVGSLTIIDNDANGKADVIIVRNYTVSIVHAADADLGAIYMKLGGANVIFEDFEAYSLSKDGKVCTVSDITEWDIASVAVNGDIAEIMLSSESVSGTISEIVKEEGKVTEIKVDGEWYEVSSSFVEKSATLDIGRSGVFFLASDGRVAAGKLSTTEKKNYAILLGAEPAAKGSGFESNIIVQLFTQEGKTEIMKVAEKITVNKKSVKREDLKAKLDELGAQYELVTIDANTDGELISLETPMDITGLENHQGYEEDHFSLDRNFASVRFSGVFGGCWMTADTLFFSIPTDKTDTDLYKCENAKQKLGSSDVTYKNIKVYDLDRFNNASVIIYSDFDKDISAENPEVTLWNQFFLISDIKIAMDEEGMERKKISGYFEGKFTEYFIADGGAKSVTEMWKPDQGRMDDQVGKRGRTKWGFAGYTDADFVIGDVIQPEVDAKGNLKFFRMLYSSKLGGVNISFNEEGKYDTSSDYLVYYRPGEFYEINELGPTQHHKDDPGYITMCYTALGRVTDVEGSIFRFDTRISMNESGVIKTYNVNRVMQAAKHFYIFSPSKGVVKQAAATDLKIGDKVFTHSKGYTVIIRD